MQSENLEEVPQTEEELVRRYSRMVLSLSRRFFLLGGDSEDLYQEGMIGLLTAFRTFDEHLTVPFESYAGLCIRRKLIDAVKSRGYEGYELISVEEEDRDVQSSLEETFIRNEQLRELLEQCRSVLSRYEYQVLELYLQGNTLSEIAASLHRDIGSVYNAVARIRQKVSAISL